MANYVTQTSDKSKKIALLCCTFGGFLGALYFYVGRYGMGLLCSLICGVLWIIDIIKIASGSFRDNAGAPLRQ